MDPLPDWSELPNNLLDSVLDRLKLLEDCFRFSVVCKSWNCVANDNIIKRAKLPSFHPPPLLLINIDKGDTWKAYNVMDNKLLDLELRLPNTRFCGSSKGWLMFVENDYSVTLVNPFFRVKGREKENSIIRLPQLLHPREDDEYYRKHFEHYVHKVTISADPLLNPNDCIVVVTTQGWSILAFIRVGRDEKWTYLDRKLRGRGFEEVAFGEDKFYGVQNNCRLLSLEIDAYSNSGLKFAANKLPQFPGDRMYLVFSVEKQMLMVRRYRTREIGKKTDATDRFEVYSLSANKSKWVRKNTLGGLALFLGDNSSISVLASCFPGCLPNCIYFLDDSLDSLEERHDFGVYSIVGEDFLTIDATFVSTLVRMSSQPAIWVLPTFHL